MGDNQRNGIWNEMVDMRSYPHELKKAEAGYRKYSGRCLFDKFSATKHGVNALDSNSLFEDESVSWKAWFKQPLFYQCAIIYLGARLYCNVIATMMNFYLVKVLVFTTEKEIADKTPI